MSYHLGQVQPPAVPQFQMPTNPLALVAGAIPSGLLWAMPPQVQQAVTGATSPEAAKAIAEAEIRAHPERYASSLVSGSVAGLPTWAPAVGIGVVGLLLLKTLLK